MGKKMEDIKKRAIEKERKMINSISGHLVDVVSLIFYFILLAMSIFIIYRFFYLLKDPIYPYYIPRYAYIFFLTAPSILFLITTVGSLFRRPFYRFIQFACLSSTLFLSVLSYVSERINFYFLSALEAANIIEIVGLDLIKGNIVILSFFLPLFLIAPLFIMLIKTMFDEDVKMKIAEYQFNFLQPDIFNISQTSVDFEICKNFMTGEPCIVPEKKLYEHILLEGGTGSGKTATVIKPYLNQLYKQKNFFIESQKRLAFQAISENVATLKAPISNFWFNQNFSMDYILPKEDEKARKRYIEIFKDFIIGERKSEKQLVSKSISKEEDIIEFPTLKFKEKYKLTIHYYKNDFLKDKSKIILEKNEFKKIKISNIEVVIEPSTPNQESQELQKEEQDDSTNESDLVLKLKALNITEGECLEVKLNTEQEDEIVYKNVGVTVISPDGELAKDAIKIADNYNVTVHKIDPSMEEINKGNVAKYNPMAGSSPEKTADDISSILMSLEQGDGGESKAYFVNAGVRAVRNLVIILKIAYPSLNEGKDPTLIDLLSLLNDPDRVKNYVEYVETDAYLSERWSSVIDYLKACFYPPPLDNNGRVIPGTNIGSQSMKTKEAIGGVINQLDNFLGREEVKYILCNRNQDENINLSEILYKGECLAISTRQNDLGHKLGKAFALFFILSIQTEVLSRFAEHENPEVPHILIIDEFPMYINYKTKDFFTFARKYKCSTLVAIQNLAQLEEETKVFRQIVLTNTNTKIIMPGTNTEDKKYIAAFFGTKEKENVKVSSSEGSLFASNPNNSEGYSVERKEVNKITESNLKALRFKECFVNYTNSKGQEIVAKGITDFVKVDPDVELKEYDFEQFNPKEEDVITFTKKENQKTKDIKSEKKEVKSNFDDLEQSEEYIEISNSFDNTINKTNKIDMNKKVLNIDFEEQKDDLFEEVKIDKFVELQDKKEETQDKKEKTTDKNEEVPDKNEERITKDKNKEKKNEKEQKEITEEKKEDDLEFLIEEEKEEVKTEVEEENDSDFEEDVEEFDFLEESK